MSEFFIDCLVILWVEAIGWMLAHSLWQGAAVGVALAAALQLLRRAPAQARYLAACFAMALLIALPVAVVGRPGLIRSVAIGRPTIQGLDRPEIGGQLVSRSMETPSVDRLRRLFPAIVGLWMAGAGVLLLRLSGGWFLSRRWARHETRPFSPSLIDGLKTRMGIRRAVALMESARVEVPMVVGWLRPAILMPVAIVSGLTALELEVIVAHELAHVRRHDYLVNLFQCLVEALVFYHPVTWWITRVIRREREHCCDDLAVAASRDRLIYARALAALEGLRTPLFSVPRGQRRHLACPDPPRS